MGQEEKEKLTSSIKDEIKIEVLTWVRKWRIRIIGGISIVSIIGFAGMCFAIYHKVEKEASRFITNSITSKFAEPNIRVTLTEVAKNEAKAILKDEIQPEITKFRTDLDNYRTDFSGGYNSLANEIEILQGRNRLVQLADSAIAEGNRSAFEELKNISKDLTKDKLSKVARAEMLRVKKFYVGMSRIQGVDLALTDTEGNKIENEEIPTDALISGLLNKDLNWQLRAKAAELLKKCKEKKVPEKLLETIQEDPNLDVVKTSLESFEAVTGFKSTDVFSYELAEKWWSENKEEVFKKLQ